MRKRVSDQSIALKENEEAETMKEIIERKGFANAKQGYRFLDNLEAQGIKVICCRIVRKNRAGALCPIPAYYIVEGK